MGFLTSIFKSFVKTSKIEREMSSQKCDLEKTFIYGNFLTQEELFYEPRKIALTEIENIGREPEMTEFESAFLCGLIKKFKPKKILEVGIAAGGTSAIILKCLDMIKLHQANLISVDLNRQFYKNIEKESGFLADQVKINGDIKHTKILGKYLPEIIETIGCDIDFFVLDTVHFLPGELLDFPVALPFLSENCIFCLHDFAYHIGKPNGFSNQLLYDTIVADKIINYGPSKENIFFPNIAAARLNSDTRKYIYYYFNAFSMPWKYMPKETELNIYNNFYKKYYKDIAFIFDLCCKANKKSMAQQQAQQQKDKKIINKILFDYFVNKYKQHQYMLCNIDFEYDKNMNWIALNISYDRKVHYEVYITSRQKIGIALHMASKYYNSYYDIFIKNQLLCSLTDFKPVIECKKYTVVYYMCDIKDIDTGVYILHFLITNTINDLYGIAGDNIKALLM
ncbi:MAG: class I SAM-dependent methyltransferase [Clostridiales bacterium]|nr:class I SAM-dependent methyltransferase [Clostridiales bacterium]